MSYQERSGSNELKSDMKEGLRLRIARNRNTDVLPKHYGESRESYKVPLPLSSTVFLSVLYILVVIYTIIVEIERRLPTPLMIEDEPNNPGRFISERAQNHVLNLTSLGPRPTGSFENEVLAVNFLSREINSIFKKAKKVHRVSMDIQKTSGSFPLDFLDGMTNVYRNVQNVIVKIGPLKSSPHSLLLNCHFDTVADSPGGSDDGASCAVMLEILRIISQSDKPLVHNIIFLFNGAEENLMQASHGFITQHKWAKEIRAFINLEACGAGGREILFQAGPENPWLMQAYSETVPYPLASSLAQEVFQSGIIPGDTDYRIFRDFGNIAGLDFAWSSNGYVYHTRLDNAAQIPLGTLQRTGDNILPLTQRLASAQEMFNVSAHKSGNLMFFDFLGAFIVSWTDFVAAIVNMGIVVLSLYTVHWNLKESEAQGIKRKVYIRQLVISAAAILGSWLVPLFTTAFIAYILTKLDRAMSWYARPAWLLFLYIMPAMFVSMSVILLVTKRQKPKVQSPWLLFRIYYDAGQIIFTFSVIFSIVFGILSGFVPAMWILFSSIGNILRERVFKKVKDWRWLGIHLLVFSLPFIQCGYTINGALLLIVPIMGRSGSGNHAEIVLSLITSAMFLLLLSFLVPVILLVRNPKRVMSFFVGVFFVSILTLVLTPLGFPYSSDPLYPRPQRFVVVHVAKTFHNIHGDVRRSDSGLWIVDLDVNSPRTVRAFVPEMEQARLIQEDCETELYCGNPYLIPVHTFIWQTHWIPGPPPVISIKTELNLIKMEDRNDNISRLTFSVVGPDHMNIMLSPSKGLKLLGWSLVDSKPFAGPKWNGRDTYFVYYSCGSNPEPWVFWIDIQKSPNHNGTLVDINLGGHFIHGAQQTTVRLRRFLSQFPPWTVTSGWTAVLKAYVF